jgi:hypothetical protein
MVDYTTYITVALRKCGGGAENMKRLGQLWSEEKDVIEEMDEDELRERLNCP